MKHLALLVTALVALTAAPATAQTVFSKDTYEGGIPAQNIKSGTVAYSASGKVTYKVRFEELSKTQSAMCTKFTRPMTEVQVCVKWSKSEGGPKIVPFYRNGTSYDRLPTTGIRSVWDFNTDTITLTLDGVPQVKGNRANVLVFALYPGAQEGAPLGDDLYIKGLQRG